MGYYGENATIKAGFMSLIGYQQYDCDNPSCPSLSSEPVGWIQVTVLGPGAEQKVACSARCVMDVLGVEGHMFAPKPIPREHLGPPRREVPKPKTYGVVNITPPEVQPIDTPANELIEDKADPEPEPKKRTSSSKKKKTEPKKPAAKTKGKKKPDNK